LTQVPNQIGNKTQQHQPYNHISRKKVSLKVVCELYDKSIEPRKHKIYQQQGKGYFSGIKATIVKLFEKSLVLSKHKNTLTVHKGYSNGIRAMHPAKLREKTMKRRFQIVTDK
jgi:hypothetical protein